MPRNPKARLEVAAQRRRAAVADGVAAVLAQAALGRDDDRVAVGPDLRSERLAQELLRGAEPVGAGGVEQSDPESQGFPRRRDRRVAVDGAPVPASRPVAERDP